MTNGIILLICASLSAASADIVVPVDFSKDCTQRSQGPWRIRYDGRDLMTMYHPWVESEKGNFAWVSREVTVPDNWEGPVKLNFYCSDDYCAMNWHPDGSWLTAEGFIDHRVKRVLVNDRVVWSSDVADPVEQGVSPRIQVELPVKPGEKFMLILLAFDTEGSKTILSQDYYQSSNNKKKREEDPDAARFMTHVYWGDVCLTGGNAEPKVGKRSTDRMVRTVHTKRWPLPPFGDPWKGPVQFDISAPAGIPKQGFPVRSGVPLASGKVKDLSNVGLKVPGNRSIATQKTALGAWPDESLRWVLFEFPAMPGMPKTELALGKDGTAFTEKGRISEPTVNNQSAIQGKNILVDTERISFAARQGETIGEVKFQKVPKLTHVNCVLQVEEDEIPAVTEAISVLEEGPFCYSVLLKGHFASMDRTSAAFQLTCTAYVGMPYLSMTFQLLNDTPASIPVSSMKIRVGLPNEPSAFGLPSGEAKPGFVLKQTSEAARTLDGASVDPAPPVFISWKEGCLAARQFRELFPKSLTAKGNEIVMDLVATENTPIVFTPGEAKTHEVWFAFGDVNPAQFAATVSCPPILQNAAYACATGVLGPAATHADVPILHEHMTTLLKTRSWEELGQHFGVRDFPDSPYYGGLPKWSNNYYERSLGLFSEWFMSGDRIWYDFAGDVSRHLLDVAVIHSEIPGKSWLGAIHGPGDNHVAEPWCPTLRTAGLDLYWSVTGDAAAREAVISVADYCMRTKAGMDSPSIRDHAGPLDAICTAYQETGDIKYLDEGSARVQAILKHMDMRRGVWPETHGSQVYRGNVPWMAAQLARPLYLWYRATGDIQAAQALVGLAESVLFENTDWDQQGVVSGYSHNPSFQISAAYDLMILPMIFAAYDLTEDSRFLEAGKAQWNRWTREKAFDSPLNCYWNTPWLMWQLREYGIVPPKDLLNKGNGKVPTAKEKETKTSTEKAALKHSDH